MAQANLLERPSKDHLAPVTFNRAPAMGLFGYSIANGELCCYSPMTGYIREIEQMPNFAPPSVEYFVARYIASNIRNTRSSS